MHGPLSEGKSVKKWCLLDKLLGKDKDKKSKENTSFETKQEKLENMGEKDVFKKKQLEKLKETNFK